SDTQWNLVVVCLARLVKNLYPGITVLSMNLQMEIEIFTLRRGQRRAFFIKLLSREIESQVARRLSCSLHPVLQAVNNHPDGAVRLGFRRGRLILVLRHHLECR